MLSNIQDGENKYEYDMAVIIPVFNAESYLSQCIDSVIEQDFEGTIQIVLVDDGSTDCSRDICKEYSSKYDNVFLYTQENSGVSRARNNGIKNALGKYILFLDSDDYISSNAVSDIFDFFEKHYEEIDLVTYPIMHDYDGRHVMHSRHKKGYYIRGTDVYSLVDHPLLVQVTINICIKNQLNEQHYFDETQSFSEDERFDTELLMEKEKIGYVKSAFYYWRENDHSTNQNRSSPYYCFEQIMDYYEYLFERYKKDGIVPKYIQQLFLNTLLWRIKEDKLLPYHYDKTKFSEAKKRIADLIKLLDVEEIVRVKKMSPNIKVRLLEIKGERLFIDYINKRFCIKCNGFRVYQARRMHLDFRKVEVKNDTLRLMAILYSPLLSFDQIALFAKVSYKNGSEEVKQIELKESNINSKWCSEYYLSPLLFDEFFDLDSVISISFFSSFRGKMIPIKRSFQKVRINFVKNGKRVFNDGKNLCIKDAGFADDHLTTISKIARTYKNDRSICRLGIKSLFADQKNKIAIYVDRNGVIDNAYYQFKHDFQIDDSIKRYYVSCGDIDDSYFTVEEKRNVINAGSEKHKFLFFNADYVFASYIDQSVFNPLYKHNKAFTSFKKFELIYLQHGILHASLLSMYTKEKTLIDKVVISSQFEYNNYISNYNYNSVDLIRSTMPRMKKTVRDTNRDKKRIVLAMSWRQYLVGRLIDGSRESMDNKYLESSFFNNISSLLSSKELNRLLEEHNAEIVVQMHPNFRVYDKYIPYSNNVISSKDVSNLFDCDLLVTDFSSFQFDFANSCIPIVYFIPDKDEFYAGLHTYRDLHMKEADRFGPMTYFADECVAQIEGIINNDWHATEEYEEKMKNFFYKVDNACEEIYRMAFLED